MKPTPQNAMLLETNGLYGTSADRRRHFRLVMAGRAARLDALGDRGLCGLLNLSDGGALIETPVTLRLGDPVLISFDCTNALQGRVVWNRGTRTGIRFLAPIVSSALLGKLAKDRWNRAARAPRLPVNGPAKATTGTNSFSTVLCDISQEGLRIWNPGHLGPGSIVDITMGGHIRVRGTVRWSDGTYAGVQLSGRLTIAQLASIKRL